MLTQIDSLLGCAKPDEKTEAHQQIDSKQNSKQHVVSTNKQNELTILHRRFDSDSSHLQRATVHSQQSSKCSSDACREIHAQRAIALWWHRVLPIALSP